MLTVLRYALGGKKQQVSALLLIISALLVGSASDLGQHASRVG